MTKPTLYVMCGIPASGKTSKAFDIAYETGANWISSDEIRRWMGDVNDQSHNKQVFDIFYHKANAALARGNDVVLDATFTTMKMRRQLFEHIKVDCTKICYVMATNYIQCRTRDLKREKSVGFEVVNKFYKSFQIPFYEEGWDKIEICSNYNDYDFAIYTSRMNGVHQHTHWHKYTLSEHCSRTAMILLHEYDISESLYDAAFLHDYGKLLTKTLDDNLEAHYYNHANAGAYYLASHGLHDLDTLFYINYHMLPFDWKEIKTSKKYLRIFGDEKFHNLILLNKADRKASGVEEK